MDSKENNSPIILKSVFDNIVKIRAYSMMALSRDTKNSTSNPDIFIIRAFDGGQFIALLLSMILLCNNFILDLILSSLFTISITFWDFTKRSRHYYIQFAKLPTKTRRKWKITMWILFVSFYVYSFAMLLLLQMIG